MVNTEISLEVSDNSNLKVMRLFDTSYYYNDEVVTNYLIEVLPVNSTNWVTFHVKKGFSLVLNSSNLRYQKASNFNDLLELPDGIYELKQSYQPNSQTVAKTYHLRTQKLMNLLNAQRTKLMSMETRDRVPLQDEWGYRDSGHTFRGVSECKLTPKEYIRNRDWLRDIEEYLIAAKWQVEECRDKQKGKELYEYSKKQLEQYTNECQCK